MLYLDFDGVICDSAIECLRIVEIQSNVSTTNEQRSRFLKDRYLVNEPFGFKVLLDLVLDGDVCEQRFSEICATLSDENQKELNSEFFETRATYIKNAGISQWIALNPPTPFFDVIRNREREIVLVSTKNYESLLLWCKTNNFNVYSIYGNESYREYGSKYNLIAQFIEDDEKIFIDDNDVHISGFDWEAINCRAISAGWGYNGLPDNLEKVMEEL